MNSESDNEHDHEPVPTPGLPKAQCPVREDGLPFFLTTNEVAALLRTTPRAVYAMIDRNQLPGVIRRSNRRLLIDTERLLQWLHQQGAASH